MTVTVSNQINNSTEHKISRSKQKIFWECLTWWSCLQELLVIAAWWLLLAHAQCRHTPPQLMQLSRVAVMWALHPLGYSTPICCFRSWWRTERHLNYRNASKETLWKPGLLNTWSRADKNGAQARVNSPETAGFDESMLGLNARFDCIKRVQRHVNRSTCSWQSELQSKYEYEQTVNKCSKKFYADYDETNDFAYLRQHQHTDNQSVTILVMLPFNYIVQLAMAITSYHKNSNWMIITVT